MRIALDTFGAEIPKLANHLLPQDAAQLARNCMTVRGDLRAFRAPLKDSALTEIAAKSLYLYEENSNDNWVVSNNVLHFVKSLIGGDSYERVYLAGETEPRFFANDNVSSPFDASTDYYKLGIPAPTTAPTVTTTGGGSTYRGYVYSFVNSYGDEGPPSPIGTDDDFSSGYVTIDGLESAPATRAITKIYLYRTNASADGTAEFQFVLEATWFSASVAYTVGDYVLYNDGGGLDLYKCTTNHGPAAWNGGNFTQGENVADADLEATYPKTNYDPPPSGLTNLISLANGAMAGFVGNQLYLSEPYYPHAWPTDYLISFDATIIGLGVAKNTITVVTEGSTYLVYGSHPSTMIKDKVSDEYPGLNIRSVISANGGTAFLTKQGLIFSAGYIENIAKDIMDPKDWEDYNPSSAVLHFYEDKYFVFDTVNEVGFVIDLTNKNFYPISVYAHAGYVTKDGKFYMVLDDTAIIDENNPPANMPLCVSEWEGDTTNYLMYTWQSKEFLLRVNTNFSIAQVVLDQDFYDEVGDLLDLATLNAATFAAGLTGALGVDGPLGGGHELAGDEMLDLGNIDISQNVTFKLYGDGTLIKTKVISTSDEKFRLPPTSIYSKVKIELSGHIPVKRVVCANSAKELTA